MTQIKLPPINPGRFILCDPTITNQPDINVRNKKRKPKNGKAAKTSKNKAARKNHSRKE